MAAFIAKRNGDVEVTGTHRERAARFVAAIANPATVAA
jgi:hypothetical protein